MLFSSHFTFYVFVFLKNEPDFSGGDILVELEIAFTLHRTQIRLDHTELWILCCNIVLGVSLIPDHTQVCHLHNCDSNCFNQSAEVQFCSDGERRRPRRRHGPYRWETTRRPDGCCYGTRCRYRSSPELRRRRCGGTTTAGTSSTEHCCKWRTNRPCSFAARCLAHSTHYNSLPRWTLYASTEVLLVCSAKCNKSDIVFFNRKGFYVFICYYMKMNWGINLAWWCCQYTHARADPLGSFRNGKQSVKSASSM